MLYSGLWRRSAVLALTCLTLSALAAPQAPYSLEDLGRLALQNHRGLEAARDLENQAQAAVRSASALPNPELELVQTRAHARLAGATEGAGRRVWLTQRLEYPWQRRARIDGAEAGLEGAQADRRAYETDLLALLRLRFFDLLRREAEHRAAEEDLALLEQIRERVALRVKLGEAARYELIKAEAEVLNAQKSRQTALLRLDQARAGLRQQVGADLPEGFGIRGDLARLPALPALAEVKSEILQANPELARARADLSQAGHQLELERSQRWPTLALKGGYDEDPAARTNGIGVVLTLPLLDRRAGPVAEASARASRARHVLDDRSFSLQQALESAYRQWQIAQTQVNALETGILRQAEAALKVAEASYRFGERGILDYLDAQRVYRSARGELIAARFDLHAAAIEVDRLRGKPLPLPN